MKIYLIRLQAARERRCRFESGPWLFNNIKMTLHEARHTLEVANPRDAAIRQAIRVVLANLPEDPEPYRPAVNKRVVCILSQLEHALDFNPFKERTRLKKFTGWRYAVWHQLRMEGYSCTQIGRAKGYDHSTVFWGDRRFCDWLEIHDYDTVKLWRQFNEIINQPQREYYGN